MHLEAALESDLSTRDIVVGVHWTGPGDAHGARSAAADLDALCELRDADGNLLEIIGPGRLSGANGSVMHTGDSRDGASRWDDERIFVFLDALPPEVRSLVFTIVSSSADPFCDVAGASCHISDSRTDEPLVELELTALGRVTAHELARVVRCRRGWRISASVGAPRQRG